MDAPEVIPQNAQETAVPEPQTSLMVNWDKLDEEAAKLKTEADQKLFGLITNAHSWVSKLNLPWLVADSDGRFTARSDANMFHFKATGLDGIDRVLELENYQTYVEDGQSANPGQKLWENNLLITSFTSDPLQGGKLRGAIRIRYRLDGLESVDAMRDSLGTVAFYPPGRGFDQNTDHDEYTVADIVYDQDDNMVDMVRIRQTDVGQRRDPFVETENTMQMLAKAQLLGRFDPYTKERLPVENTPQAIDAQTQ